MASTETGSAVPHVRVGEVGSSRRRWGLVAVSLAGAVALALAMPLSEVFSAQSAVLFIGLFGLAVWLAGRRHDDGPRQQGRLGAPCLLWGWYALPMALAWLGWLLVFWPGIMNNDVCDQWAQMSNPGALNDHHPAFHTLTMWLITRAWFSPAAVAVVQIVALGLIAGAGFARIEDLGVPRRFVRAAVAIMAVSPVNGVMVISLWKDTMYAIAFAGLCVILLAIYASRGRWLDRWRNCAVLAGVCALVSLYRHNGWPIAVAALAAIAFFQWRQGRTASRTPSAIGRLAVGSLAGRLVFAAAAFVAIWLGVRGPIYRVAGVKGMGPAMAYAVPLHHLGAHLKAGTRFTDEELAVLNAVRPVDERAWDYDPYNINPLIFAKEFRRESLERDGRRVAAILGSAMLREPAVDLRHWGRSSALVWRITVPADGFMDGPNIFGRAGRRRYIDTAASPATGLAESSKAPFLLEPAASAVLWSLERDVVGLFWRPATYLYLLLFGLAVALVRERRAGVLLVVSPALVQSAMMALLCIHQSFRYQYSVYLCALLLWPLLLVGGRGTEAPSLNYRDSASLE